MPIRPFATSLALATFGITLALLLGGALLLAFPQWRPGVVQYTVGDGDIFFHQRHIVQVPPDADRVLSTHVLRWDADGFRLPANPADAYDVLALGDSYTEASMVAQPWPDVLARASGLAVRNLGHRGYGSPDQARILREFGPQTAADIVIVGYFEGNDLSDAASGEWREFAYPDAADPVGAEFVLAPIPPEDARYPVRVELAGTIREMAFFEPYIWWLNGTRADYAQSRNLDLIAHDWRTMRDAMPGACLIVAYFPSKPHIYLPYLLPEDRPAVLEALEARRAAPGELLAIVPNAQTPFAALLERLGNQRDAVAARAAREGLPFVDVTPVLQAGAAQGGWYYYAYDTHWNQAGHDAAGAALAAALAAGLCT